jgi:predicted regulator of Ras-like GTPase activity (Roadblock/LC7/MglB family)
VIAHLESLSRLPGVEFVLLISNDGVPIAHAGGTSESAREESLAALAAAWLNEVGQAVAPLGWRAPERICLRAARGTLVLRHTESASLLVCLGRETSPEDVRLSMDGTLARIERARTGRATAESAPLRARAVSEPDGPIPYRADAPPVEEGLHPAHPDHPPGH